MPFFLLLHGAWHGGWCWDEVVGQLARAGHRAAAPDLPVDDVAAGWNRYADAAVHAVEGVDGEVIVVGHSLAGGVVPLVADRRPVSRMVFISCFPPNPAMSLDESLAGEPDLTDPAALVFRDSVDEKGRYTWPSFESARYAMYQDCPVDTARRAFERLRPQATRPFSERWPLDHWPPTPITFIVCSDDRMGGAAPLRRLARDRFGVDAVQLEGGHSPFISRPDELVAALVTSSHS